MVITKVCKKCGQKKDLDQFYKTPGHKDGHSGNCKTCYCKSVKSRIQNMTAAQKKEYNRKKKAREKKRYETNEEYRNKVKLNKKIGYTKKRLAQSDLSSAIQEQILNEIRAGNFVSFKLTKKSD